MRKNIYYFNSLLRTYNRYRRKLANLRKANKNERRQHILQNHIERLFEKLTFLRMSIKLSTVAASIAVGTLAFVPQTASAQSFSAKEINPFNLSGVYRESAPTFADLDGDGDYDMLTGNDYGVYNYSTYMDEYQFQYFENVGTAANPVFAAPVNNPFGITSPNTDGELAPTFVDIDGDGDVDIMYGNYYSPMFYFLENVGTPTNPSFAPAVSNPFGLTDHNGYSSYSSVLSFADLDNDGDLDMITGDYYGEFYYFENTGDVNNPTFIAPVQNPFGLTYSSDRTAPVFIDIDNDGDYDLIHGDWSGDFYYFENTGTASTPAFGSYQVNPFSLTEVGSGYYGGSQSKPAFVDIDNDGDIDIVAGDRDGDFSFYRQCLPSTASISPTAVCDYTSPSGQIYLSGGTFTEVFTNSTGCDSILTINLTIESIADQTVSAANSTICGTGSTTIDLGSSQNGVNYYLRRDDNDSIVAGPIVGNGTMLSFDTDTISFPTTYNVYGDKSAYTTGLFFDGTNAWDHKVVCGNDNSVQLSGNTITLEAWIYPTNWISVNQGHIINKENNGPGTDYGYMIRCGDNGKINFNLGNGNWNEITTTSTPLVLNTWQHVAATYDGSIMSIYVDGNLIETKNAANINFISPLRDLTIGSWAGGNGSIFAGNIDEVRVWSVSRTQAEIQANMNTCLTGAETGLAAYYQFEDGTGSTTLTDLSPNANHGTLQNMDPNTVWSIGSTVCSTCNLEMSQTITINVGQATVETISPTACNAYVSPSGNYTWTTSATYLDTIPNVAGCDSVITVNLTINSVDVTVDNSLMPILSANQAGATYRWLDCDNGNAPISGEMGQTFTATANGNYAVEVTFNGCTDTSACEAVTGVGVNEAKNTIVSIYPNPTNGMVSINLGSKNSVVDYTISSIEGKVIETGKTSSNIIAVDLSNESKGVYFIRINTENTSTVYKLIKQ